MKQYKKPSIVKVSNPLYAKHGMALDQFNSIRSDIEGHTVKALAEEYGSPLFVFSQSTMTAKYDEAYGAIKARYPKVKFGWSYKTNYLKAVCQTFHDLGAIAEVVSDFEYDKARSQGVPGHNIIYNGPYKSVASLERAVRENAIINVDHFGEIEDLEAIGQKSGKVVPIGIRINCNTDTYPHWNRFGFNLESGQAMAGIRRIVDSEHLDLVGIHSHIGTFILDANAYRKASEKVVALLHVIEGLTHKPIQYLDLGGGFASLSHLRGIYQSPEIVVPTVEKYAECLTGPLQELKGRVNPPTLYMELGRHLIDEAGYLISSVVGDKILPDGRRSYILDGGVNLLYTSSWYKFNAELADRVEGMLEPSILNGPLCMNIDVVEECIMLPRLKRGQKMVFSPVGAYNVTQWMQFIRLRPAVVMIKENGQLSVIRRSETLADVEAPELGLLEDAPIQKMA
jgi:diaminopimelate decarboxylase